jgi:glycerophosphoryl diester phosphodiesterase
MTSAEEHPMKAPSGMARPLLIHHAANRGYDYPQNSLGGLRRCLEAGARVVEVDIIPLRNSDFALLHDSLLEDGTNGRGPVHAATVDQVRSLRHVYGGVVTDERVGLLSEGVSLIRDYVRLQELQLDLKASAPPTDAVLNRLLRIVEPVKDKVRVTSGADWAVRRLRALDADLPLGFDPLLYLEVSRPGEQVPPFRLGAYGYWDDHPLATWHWGTSADYLAARAEVLWTQAPANAGWYIRASLLSRALDDGFDWIAYLHARSVLVDAWTLDAEKAGHLELARRLISAGVDRITTNDAPRLAAALDGAVGF